MSTVVLVDLDNVVADFDRRFRDLWATRRPESRLPDDRRHHRIVDDLSDDQRSEATAILAETGFTSGMAPVEGAGDALAEIVDHGFAVYICTSPLSAPHRTRRRSSTGSRTISAPSGAIARSSRRTRPWCVTTYSSTTRSR